MSKIVAVIGAIASGKSELLAIFAKMGLVTLSLDKINLEIIENNLPDSVIAILKEAKLDSDLSKAEARRCLFFKMLENAKLKKMIESILQPLIVKALKQKLVNFRDENYVVVEIPLFLELRSLIIDSLSINKVIALVVDAKKQKQALLARGFSSTTIKQVLEIQPKAEEILKYADYQLNNFDSTSLEFLELEAKKLYDKLLSLA